MITFRRLTLLVVFVVPTSLWAQLAVRSAASYGEEVSPGSLAALFGDGLSPTTAVGKTDNQGRWPRKLGEVLVEVDGFAAGLLFVSPNQINFAVPLKAPLGTLRIIVRHTNRVVLASGVMEVTAAAPALFSADGSDSGSALAFNRWTDAPGPFSLTTGANPGCDKRTKVSALATGLRLTTASRDDPFSSNLADFVRLVFDSPAGSIESDEVEYAGPDETLEGVDRVNFALPSELEGNGQVSFRLVVDGLESNSVVLNLQSSETENSECVADGFMVSYSTVADLLDGDLWDVTHPQAVFARLAGVPEHWPLMGVGTTAEIGHNGEVIAFGTTGLPELVWSDPLFPPAVRTLTNEPIPFAGIAAGNPDHAVVAEATAGRPIHAQIVELAEQNNLAFAGIRVSGRLSGMSYSVAHDLLKEGTPLTDPSVDKAPFQLFFDVEEEVEWELSGFYGISPAVQKIVSVRGAPVHLHGFQLDRSRAGHVGSAVVEHATIRLYPLQAPVVEDADLSVRLLMAAPGRVGFEVLNRGNNTVARTTVQGLLEDRVLFQITIPALAGRENRLIETKVPTGMDPGQFRIVVDPFNDVLESDEANNTMYLSDLE